MDQANSKPHSKEPSPTKSKSNSNGEDVIDPLLDDSGTEDQDIVTPDDVHHHGPPRKESRLSEVENLSSSESYPASSHFTENTDSVTGGLGLSNRVIKFIF